MLLHDLDDASLARRGVILFSGGADSTLLARALIRRGKELVALSIDYPGRPAAEIARAEKIARNLGMELVPARLDLPWRPVRGTVGGLDEGWFPHRNVMFLSLALHVAEVRGARFVTAGYARSDGIVFSDATPEFLGLFVEIARLSSGRSGLTEGIDILMPLVEKDEFFRAERAVDPGLAELIASTWSCWRNEAEPCGVCAACRERKYYFETAQADTGAG